VLYQLSYLAERRESSLPGDVALPPRLAVGSAG
jgi:hypothetical protein